MRLLWAVDHGLQSLSKRMKGELGVTGPQRFTLRMIGRKPGISAGALASVLHLDPSTLTGVLHRLEERGSIKRSADPADRRRALFYLTPRGRSIDVVKTRTVESAVRRALASVAPGQVESSRAVLAALIRELEEGG
jgi:MarR family transcriptional regulator, organic hydroperoxide resistance regulator